MQRSIWSSSPGFSNTTFAGGSSPALTPVPFLLSLSSIWFAPYSVVLEDTDYGPGPLRELSLTPETEQLLQMKCTNTSSVTVLYVGIYKFCASLVLDNGCSRGFAHCLTGQGPQVKHSVMYTQRHRVQDFPSAFK
jgi:hypothetical protein